MAKNKRILIISDLHMPYHHYDTVKFLRAINDKYNPDRVIFTGDELDKHAMSFHDSDPDLFSAGFELKESIKYMRCIYDMFPVADLMESNHGSMVYRKAKVNGIPRAYLKDYGTVIEAPNRWQWHEDLVVKLPTGLDCYFSHGMGGKADKVSQTMSMCAVQGHRHNDFFISYWSNKQNLFWSMSVGCMIDSKGLAMAYGKYFPKRPIIGHGIILDGLPKLLPMILNNKGRWNGVTP